MRSIPVAVATAAFLAISQPVWAQPCITMQVLEIKFDEHEGVDLVHTVTISGEEGWSGQVNFTYAFSLEHLFENPQELLEWEKKVEVKTQGAQTVSSFDFAQGRTVVTIDVLGAMAEVDAVIRMHLINMVEMVRTHSSLPLLMVGGKSKRFSMVTPRSNLEIARTRVALHLPDGQRVTNCLPTQNVTVLPRIEGSSIFWSFGGEGANEARVYVEFGPQGRMGGLMVLIIVLCVLGVVLAAFKAALTLYEESVVY